MDEIKSEERKYIHEAIAHVADLGYLTLPERRVLLRNTIRILKQSQSIDEQPLPEEDQAELLAAPELITDHESALKVRANDLVGKRWWNNGRQNRQFPVGVVPKGWKLGRTYHRRFARRKR
jgi:hypothetical protein